MIINRLIAILVLVALITTGCSILNLNQSDAAALDSLREAGSDMSKPHPFDFYLYHAEKAGAQFLCAELEQEGFDASVLEGAIEGEWLCLAKSTFVPSIERLSDFQRLFEDLINTYGGEYDGWETVVIK